MRWTHAFLAPFLESWASEGVVPFFFGGGPMTHLNLPPFGFLAMDLLTGGFLTGGMVSVDLVQTGRGKNELRCCKSSSRGTPRGASAVAPRPPR